VTFGHKQWRKHMSSPAGNRTQPPEWKDAPEGWNWMAQDEDGRWFWYRSEPRPGIGGGVWRANSRDQQLAAVGVVNDHWVDTLSQRPSP
jgi:hypothetical protein